MKNCTILIAIMLFAVALTAENRIVFYHNNYGMLSEVLAVPLEAGKNTYEYHILPNDIDDNTVILQPSGRETFTILSQSFHKPTDIITLRNVSVDAVQQFFNEYIGKQIELVLTDGSLLSGEMLFNDRSVVGISDRQNNQTFVVRYSEIRNFVFPTIEFDFDIKPPGAYLSWNIEANRAGEFPASLTYLTRGFSWEGIYKAIWDDETLILDVFAKITNNSGKDIEDYRVLLIAGEPKKIDRPTYRRGADRMMLAKQTFRSADSVSPEFSAEVFDEFHLFSYSEKINLANNERKHLRLYDRKSLKPTVHYEYRTGTKTVNTTLTIKNNRQNNLGEVLPTGKIQLYRAEGRDKALTFVGEDFVNQTPVDEEWIISPGRAFDVLGETTIVDSRRPSRNITERDMSVTVKNRSDKTRNVEVVHNISGNWTISRNSHPYERKDASTVVFKLDLRSNRELTITWTERIEY